MAVTGDGRDAVKQKLTAVTLLPCPCSKHHSFQIEELTLKSSATTELKILFDEPWLVQFSHARLKGDVPIDREWCTLSALCSKWSCWVVAGAWRLQSFLPRRL